MAKNPWVAALLSFLIAGLGQLYLGKVKKAIAFLTLYFAISYVLFDFSESLGIILTLIVTAVSVVDAYHTAKNIPYEKPEEKEQIRNQPEVRVF